MAFNKKKEKLPSFSICPACKQRMAFKQAFCKCGGLNEKNNKDDPSPAPG